MEEEKKAENVEDKKKDEKEEEKKEDEKEEEKRKKEKEEDEKTRKKREKEEKKRLKKEKEKEDKEKRKKEKEEKRKQKLEKEKEEKEKKKEEKEKKKKEKEEKKKKGKEEKEDKKKGDEKQSEKINIIYSIDEENKKCVDCGAENPTKVSINNGVIICQNCAKEHEELGHSISFLKNIEDDFDEFLIHFIVMGSNTKFKRFLTQENVDSKLPIKSKYKTNAVYFYRKNLKAKVEGKKEFEKDFEDPNALVGEEDENIFPEFQKKYVLKNQILRKGTVLNQHRFTFRNIFNKVFTRNKKKRGRSLDKEKKRRNDIEINDIDMNKTSPPELMSSQKEPNILESNRPFQEEDKKEDDKKNDDIGHVITSTGLNK